MDNKNHFVVELSSDLFIIQSLNENAYHLLLTIISPFMRAKIALIHQNRVIVSLTNSLTHRSELLVFVDQETIVR